MNVLFLKLFLRRFRKTRLYSTINILGLTVGFTSFILITLFIRYEYSWDKNNQNYSRIYRIQRHTTNALYVSKGNNISPHTRAVTAQMIEKQFPEFEKLTVIWENESTYLGIDEQHIIHEKEGISADSCFFDVFTYQFLHGDKAVALMKPYSIVLSETMAMRLFNRTDVLGETIFLEKKYPLKVTGVFKDLPFNSSIRAPYIISFSTLKPLYNIDRSSLWTGNCMTFALLRHNVDAKIAEGKIKNLFGSFESIKYEELQLCPLSKVYVNFNDSSDYLIVHKLFGLIGLFVLLMSCFNYINLSLAQTSLNGKEVAIKKINGSRHNSLVFQFLGETVFISVIAFIIALCFSQILLPIFNNVVDKRITFSIVSDWKFVLFMFLIAVVTGLLSGVYPAVFMVSNKITTLFKGSILEPQKNFFSLKKALVTLQFAISLFLIIVTLSFTLQIKYLSHKNLGFDNNGLMYSEIDFGEQNVDFQQLKDRLVNYPEIKDVSISKNFPFVRQGGGTTNWEGGAPDDKITCRYNTISDNYMSFLNTDLIAGRNFNSEYQGDLNNNCIINETAAKCFGWENPIGKRIKDNQYTVIGVVKDFIFHDMHNPIEPGIYTLASNVVNGKWILSFRMEGNKENLAKSLIAQELGETYPLIPFEINSFSLAFNNENSYRSYHSLDRALKFFTIVNILLAVLGVFGLVSFTVTRRTKEIGIRKINGCSVVQIFNILNKDYYILLIISVLISFPMSWWVYSSIPCANKLSAQPFVFVLAIVVLFVIILLSTCFLTIKAATKNPVEALRYE